MGTLTLERDVACRAVSHSPGSPSPVFSAIGTGQRVGGAGAVGVAVARAGGAARVLGSCGRDEEGDALLGLLTGEAAITSHAIRSATRRTAVRTRYCCGSQLLLALDDGSEGAPDEDEAQRLIAWGVESCSWAEAVAITEVEALPPQVVAQVLLAAARRRVPVIAAPRAAGLPACRDVACIVVDGAVLGQAFGRTVLEATDLVSAARAAMERHGTGAVVVQLTSGAALLVSSNGEVHPGVALHDSAAELVAGLALALAAGFPLRAALGPRPSPARAEAGKHLADDEALLRRAAAWRADGRRVALVAGTFDILTAADIALLTQARAAADRLVVAIGSDGRTRRVEGRGRPVNPLADRMEVLAALEAVDAVIAFDSDTPLALIERLSPEVLVRRRPCPPHLAVGSEHVMATGGHVLLVDRDGGSVAAEADDRVPAE